jgi:hypothetical protein
VRVIERLIGDEAVDLRRLDAGVVEASFDAFEMKRVRTRLRSLAHFSFADADNGVPAADSPMVTPNKNTQRYGSKSAQ